MSAKSQVEELAGAKSVRGLGSRDLAERQIALMEMQTLEAQASSRGLMNSSMGELSAMRGATSNIVAPLFESTESPYEKKKKAKVKAQQNVAALQANAYKAAKGVSGEYVDPIDIFKRGECATYMRQLNSDLANSRRCGDSMLYDHTQKEMNRVTRRLAILDQEERSMYKSGVSPETQVEERVKELAGILKIRRIEIAPDFYLLDMRIVRTARDFMTELIIDVQLPDGRLRWFRAEAGTYAGCTSPEDFVVLSLQNSSD